jgi:hypothetical protein
VALAHEDGNNKVAAAQLHPFEQVTKQRLTKAARADESVDHIA